MNLVLVPSNCVCILCNSICNLVDTARGDEAKAGGGGAPPSPVDPLSKLRRSGLEGGDLPPVGVTRPPLPLPLFSTLMLFIVTAGVEKTPGMIV